MKLTQQQLTEGINGWTVDVVAYIFCFLLNQTKP